MSETTDPTAGEQGLEARYHVEKINDPTGKHDACRYFVLDPAHDLIARQALAFYRNHARRFGYAALADDLTEWLDGIDPATTPFPGTPDAGDASEGLSEDERKSLRAAIHLPVYNPISEAILAEVERIVAAREAAARAEGVTDTADELWRIFLRLPNTPSPLGDYIQRRVAEFRDHAARIARAR